MMDEVADSHGKFTREGAAAVEERDYERATTLPDEAFCRPSIGRPAIAV